MDRSASPRVGACASAMAGGGAARRRPTGLNPVVTLGRAARSFSAPGADGRPGQLDGGQQIRDVLVLPPLEQSERAADGRSRVSLGHGAAARRVDRVPART